MEALGSLGNLSPRTVLVVDHRVVCLVVANFVELVVTGSLGGFDAVASHVEDCVKMCLVCWPWSIVVTGVWSCPWDSSNFLDPHLVFPVSDAAISGNPDERAFSGSIGNLAVHWPVKPQIAVRWMAAK